MPRDKESHQLEGSDNVSYLGTDGKLRFFQNEDIPPPYYKIPRAKLAPATGKAKVSAVAIPDEAEEENEREQWSNPIEFLLSCIALSVGLGNVWRFPITAFNNGGGAFLIPYLIVLIFIGRPLYFLELSLGQFSSFGCIKLWKAIPAAKGIGYSQVVATCSILTYYVSLMALTIFYFINSFRSVLPWAECDPSWADMDTCIPVMANNITSNSFSTGKRKKISSAEMYFQSYVTHEASSWESGLGYPDWKLALCLAGAWFVLFLTLVKGVKSAGKAAYFTALFPYVVLFTLLGRGVTLPGAVDGILFYLTPQWEKLLDPMVWYNAVAQSFFSLSVAFGSISMFSSYNSFKHNVYRDAWIISFMDTGTSFLAGLTIFAILGNLKYELQAESMDDVVKAGAGLAFIAYPTAIAKLDYIPQLFAVLFFLMLFTLGLGSASALTNCVITVICDQKPNWNKALVTAAVCIAGFVLGLIYVTPEGLWILEVIDFFGGGSIVFILAILEAFVISWIYGMNKIIFDLKFMLDVQLGLYWKLCWSFVVPGGLTAILVYSLCANFSLPTYRGHVLPHYAYVSGYILVGCAMVVLPLCFCHAYYIADCPPGSTCLERLKFVFQPKDTWGPKRAKDRKDWMEAKRLSST